MGPRGLAAISQLSRLERLEIAGGGKLEPDHFVSAFSLGRLSNLRYLDLSHCSKLDDAGVIR